MELPSISSGFAFHKIYYQHFDIVTKIMFFTENFSLCVHWEDRIFCLAKVSFTILIIKYMIINLTILFFQDFDKSFKIV